MNRMIERSNSISQQRYVEMFNAGIQDGFNYLYEIFRNSVFDKAQRAVGDYCMANTITQESFTRLWVFRSTIRSVHHAEDFLIKEVKKRVQCFYQNAAEQFHRNLVQLDALPSIDWISPRVYMEEDEPKSEAHRAIQREWTRKMNGLMPNLREDQQQLLRLCLAYGFNYNRIAEHLDGYSSNQISFKVNRAIAYVRRLFERMEKHKMMPEARRTASDAPAVLDPDEEQVLHLRMKLRYSFPEIAEIMRVEIATVNQLFIRAYRKRDGDLTSV